MPRLSLSGRITLLVALNVIAAVVLTLLADRFVRAIHLHPSFVLAAAIALVFVLVATIWTSRIVARRIVGSLTATRRRRAWLSRRRLLAAPESGRRR